MEYELLMEVQDIRYKYLFFLIYDLLKFKVICYFVIFVSQLIFFFFFKDFEGIVVFIV